MFPLVTCYLKSDKHSVHCKLCGKDFRINQGEISHVNAHAKGNAHENHAKSNKEQRTFTISSNLFLSKLSTLLNNIHTLNIRLNLQTVHTHFLGNFLLYIAFLWSPPTSHLPPRHTPTPKNWIFQLTQANFFPHLYKGFWRILNL